MSKERTYKNYLLPAICLVMVFLSCVSNKVSDRPDIHTSEISLSWAGVYAGVTPAADGPGIEVQLTLNYDRTFALQYRYIDRGDEVFFHEGTLTWDKTGEVIVLDIKDWPPYYRAWGDSFIQLDMQGNRITGDLADHYILKKIADIEEVIEP